uniref:2-C-methyl-D-erythritol 4-phosphate cytidylyltransferase n=1 Tax=Bacillus mycoides TaxID=1405 RepID=UPI0016432752
KHKPASISALPVKHTLKKVQHHTLLQTLQPSHFTPLQTPQPFSLSLLLQPHTTPKQASFLPTHHPTLLQPIPKQLPLLHASYYNIKLTTPQHLLIPQTFFPLHNQHCSSYNINKTSLIT